MPPVIQPAHLAAGAAVASAAAAQAHAASGGHWALTALLVTVGVAALVVALLAWRKNFRIIALLAAVDPASQAVPAASLAQAQSQ